MTSDFLTLNHSSVLLYFEHNFNPNFCLSHADFEGECNEPSMTKLVEVVDRRKNEVSKGVLHLTLVLNLFIT